MQTAANTTPMPIRTSSAWSTAAGGLACRIRQATAAITAATPTPVITGRFQGALGREKASAAPNKGSVVEARGPFSCLANGVNDSVRDPNLSSGPVRGYLPVLAWGLCGTVRFKGGRRPAWRGLTFSPSESLDDRRPAVACRVRSFA